MADIPPVHYVRLPGSGLSRKGGSLVTVARVTCRLWLGDDHLLQVEAVGGYAESYKRFYFQDIQAIYIHKTSSWRVANIILGLLTGLLLLWTLSTKDSAGVIVLGIVTGIFGLFLLVSVFRGPTCVCHLKTAVHLEELPSLRRSRNAEKVLAQLKPLIGVAQGSATAEVVAQYAALLAGVNATSAVQGQFLRAAGPTVGAYRGRSHQMLFIALLTGAMVDVLNILLPCIPVVFLNMANGAVVAGAVVIALVKQNQTDLKFALRMLTWITGGFIGLGYVTGYVIMIFITPEQHLDGTQWGFIKGLANLRPLETPWWLAVLSSTAAVAALLGAAGLLLLRQHWREKEAVA